MDARSCVTQSTATSSLPSHQSHGRVKTFSVLSDRIAQRTGKAPDESWLENGQNQELRRRDFQNASTIDRQQKLRQCTNKLSNTTDSIEKHCCLRKHVERKDSKVSKNLKHLVLRGQRFIAEIQKDQDKPRTSSKLDCSNENGCDLQFKNGWIDLPQNHSGNKLKGDTFLDKCWRPSLVYSKKSRQKQLVRLEEEKITPSDKCTRQQENIIDNTTTPLGKIGFENFVRRKSTDSNFSLDNGEFSVW